MGISSKSYQCERETSEIVYSSEDSQRVIDDALGRIELEQWVGLWVRLAFKVEVNLTIMLARIERYGSCYDIAKL